MVGLDAPANEIGGICPINRLYNVGNKTISVYIKYGFESHFLFHFPFKKAVGHNIQQLFII